MEGWKDGELAEGRKRRLLSLSVLCSALSLYLIDGGGEGREGKGGRGGMGGVGGWVSCI